MTIQEFAAAVRKKSGAYTEVPDEELVRRVVEKYPEYKKVVDLVEPQAATGFEGVSTRPPEAPGPRMLDAIIQSVARNAPVAAATGGAGSLAARAAGGPLARLLLPALARIGAQTGIRGGEAALSGEPVLPAMGKTAALTGAAEALLPPMLRLGARGVGGPAMSPKSVTDTTENVNRVWSESPWRGTSTNIQVPPTPSPIIGGSPSYPNPMPTGAIPSGPPVTMAEQTARQAVTSKLNPFEIPSLAQGTADTLASEPGPPSDLGTLIGLLGLKKLMDRFTGTSSSMWMPHGGVGATRGGE